MEAGPVQFHPHADSKLCATVRRMARSAIARRTFLKPRGLFARIARQFRVDPSYVSRVAHGHRQNDKIGKALTAELRKLIVMAQKSIRKDTRK